jgi:hypothetical protein
MNPRLKVRAFGSAGLVVLTATVAWLMVKLPLAQDTAERAESRSNQALTSVAELKKQADENRQGLVEANRRLKAAGKQPVPVPAQTPVQVPSSDGLSAEEYATVRAMIDAEVSKARAPITQAEVTQIARVAATFVPRPRDGKSVTAAELQPLVAVALATYCGEGRCTGRAGDDGAKGDTGDRGADAPKVTDEQLRPLIATSLAAYCGQPDKPCDGRDGKDGAPCDPAVNSDCIGPVGAEGRGVADMDCNPDTRRWEVRYTKGANSSEGDRADGGPCLADPVPSVSKAGR